MKRLVLLFVFLAATAQTAHAQFYSTAFPASENPISQSGTWISGGAAGNNSTGGCPPAGGSNQCWKDVQTTAGRAFGQQTDPACSGQVGQNCNDATAVLTGTWASNQLSCGTVFIDPALNRANFEEIELRLNTTISLHSITGYEFTYSTKNSGQYAAFARWNGPLGQFTGQPLFTSIPVLATGDIVCVKRVGGTMTAWHNRAGTITTIGTYTDSTYLNGSPGIGAQTQNAADVGKAGWSSFTAANYAATTCNQSDVQAQVNLSANGNTVIIPAGACTWSSTVVIPNGIAINVIGNGTPNSLPNQVGAGSCTATNITLQGIVGFSAKPAYGAPTLRFSCMTFTWGSGANNVTVPFGILGTCSSVASNCPSIRVDNVTFNGWAGRYQINHLGDVFGVMDHNTINGSTGVGNAGYVELVSVGHASFLGVGLWGDNSWAQSEMYGSSNFLFIENNLFNGSGCCEDEISAGGLSNEGGSRVVARFNTFNAVDTLNFTLGWHGTETGGRPRSGRAWEYYKNTYNVPAKCTDGTQLYTICAGAIQVRGGTGLTWGNTINSAATAGFNGGLFGLNLLRANGPVNWGVCDGTNPIDGNDPSSNLSNPSFSGTIVAYNPTTGVVTVNGSPGWATNQWVPAGQAYSFHDVTATAAANTIQQGGEIQSNTANTFTIIPASQNVHQQDPKIGDSILITRALWCMDQGGGRGAGIYQVGNATPQNATPPFMFVFSNEVSSPAYFWMNSYPNLVPSVGNIVVPDYKKIQPNRDWYIETPNQIAQTSPTSPFNGSVTANTSTAGTGYGTIANRPTSCTTGVFYWATDQGNWNTTAPAGMSGLGYHCTATNTWTQDYTPGCYPHPIITGNTCGGTGSPGVGLSPSSVSFGSVLVGSTSPITPVTLTNTGTALLTIASISITGANPADFAQTNNCGNNVLAGGSCTISVTCSPASAASFSASVSVSDNAAGSPQTVPLSCTGVTATAVIGFSPTSVTFAGQTVGTSSSPTAVTVSNSGSGNLVISGIAISGGNTTSFSQTNNCGTVAPSGTCTINVTFRPQVAGALSSSISVTDNAAGSPQSVPLSGTGNGVAAISFTPTSLAFGNQTVGVTSSALSTVVKNTGTAALTFSSVTLTGTNASDYAISANSCSGSIAVNSTCSVSVTVTTGATGSRTANISFADNAPASPQIVPLSATGTQSGTNFSPSSLAFGNQNVNSSSAPMTTTLTNTGTSILHISSIAISGTNAADFSISSNTCGATVAISATCILGATFTPSGPGSRSANLTFTDDAPGSPQAVPLSGTGVSVSGALQISPTSLVFGSTVVGSPSSPQQLTALNAGRLGDPNIVVSSVTASGDFTVVAQNCTGASGISPGQSCTINVTFTPSAVGARTGTVTVTSSASNSPTAIGLSGIGTQSGALVSPTSLTFAAQAVGTTSPAQVITLTNNGTAILNISSIALRPQDTYFAISANTCGPTLAINASCTVSETFTPATSGSFTSLLSFADNGPSSPQTVSGSGTGTSISLSFNPASLTFPNTPVSTASAPLTVSVQNTGTGVVTFSSISITGTNASNFAQTNNCGTSLAANATCTVSTTFTPSANGSRTAAITFTDSAPGSPQTVSLQGTGFTPAPAVTLSMSTAAFGNQAVATQSNPQVVVLTNTGTATLTVSTATMGGSNPGDFGFSTTCGGSLAVNASCTYSLTFTPTTAGSRAATFSVNTNAASSPDNVSLTGTGIASPPGAPAPQVFGDD